MRSTKPVEPDHQKTTAIEHNGPSYQAEPEFTCNASEGEKCTADKYVSFY